MMQVAAQSGLWWEPAVHPVESIPRHLPVDFDLHGIVGIRLLDAEPDDVATVTAQLGPIQAPLQRSPDVVIRFVDRSTSHSPLCLIGDAEAGHADGSFYVLRGRRRQPVRVEIPFDRIGMGFEIRCERGVSAVPLLMQMVNLCAAANGALPLHASAVRYQGKGVLVTGWSKGGKTETLLAFIANGAEYVGDEWIYLTRNGTATMRGIPEPIRVWDWHLDELPELRRRLSPLQRSRRYALRRLAEGLESAADSPRGVPPLSWRKPLARLAESIGRQCYTRVAPQAAFSEAIGSLCAPLEHVVFVESWSSPRIETAPMAGSELAARMAFSMREERSDFMSCYRKFRFAMPDRANRLIDTIDETEAQDLQRIFGNRICHVVRHPYPVSVPALFHAVRPLIEC